MVDNPTNTGLLCADNNINEIISVVLYVLQLYKYIICEQRLFAKVQ